MLMVFTSDQIPENEVDAALQQALSEIGNHQRHIPVKFHENCEQTQAGNWGIWESSIDFSWIIYALRCLGLSWINCGCGLDMDVDRFRLRSVQGLNADILAGSS
jgi:hypothetical protein